MFTIYPINNPIAFNFFDFPVRWYGICLAIAIFVGVFFGNYLILKKYSKFDSEAFLDCILPVVIFSIFGARLFYVLGDFSFYLSNPLEIIMINHGGLSIYGAIFIGAIVLFFYLKNKKLDILKFFDIFALMMPLCQSIGRFGNYFNQEAFGSPTNGFIRLFVDEMYRPSEYANFSFFHPTFLYESVLNFILFLFLLYIFLHLKNRKFGLILSLYLIFYSLIRIFVESIRIDSVFDVGNYPIAIILSIISLLSGIVIFFYTKKYPAK